MDDLHLPEDLRYDLAHTWVRTDGDEAVMGITEFAARAWGEVGFAQLPKVGDAVLSGEAAGILSCASAGPCDVIPALSGEVVAVNDALSDQPELVNEDPYGEGWLFRIAPSDPAQLRDLLNAGDYRYALASPLPDPSGVLGPVFQHSADAMVILDEHRRVLALNPAAEALTGYRSDRVAGAGHCYNLFRCECGGETLHGIDCAGVAARAVSRPGRARDFSINRRDGVQIPVSAVYSPIPRPDGLGVFLLVTLRTREVEES
ncbi:MAG TPA: PAS domain S-box protein [Armatimonadota bacterium]|jgi:glycine cleavage system H protein